MGKQAKKKQKSETQVQGQQRHNRATRGMNTRRRGTLWAVREVPKRDKKGVVQKDEDGNVLVQTYNVYVPPRVGWDIWDKAKNDPKKALEPFDSLHLDWREEMMEFAADNNARIGKIDLGEGVFLYRVFRGSNVLKPDEVFFEVQSSKKFTLERERKRKRVRK